MKPLWNPNIPFPAFEDLKTAKDTQYFPATTRALQRAFPRMAEKRGQAFANPISPLPTASFTRAFFRMGFPILSSICSTEAAHPLPPHTAIRWRSPWDGTLLRKSISCATASMRRRSSGATTNGAILMLTRTSKTAHFSSLTQKIRSTVRSQHFPSKI